MKTHVFGVCYWGQETPHYLDDWHARIKAFLPHEKLFLCPGSYSNPDKLHLADVDVVQIGVQNTEHYTRDWCYFYVGFMTGIYHALLNLDFDILVHVQDRTLIGNYLIRTLEEFSERKEILCAPKLTSQLGIGIETGFMAMKREAVLRYATSNLRCALSQYQQMNVEDEAFYMFGEDWWNPFPEVHTTRQEDHTYSTENSPFTLSKPLTARLPIIASGKHCNERYLSEWKKNHPIPSL